MFKYLIGFDIYTVKIVIYTVDYIFQHAFSTLTLFGPQNVHPTQMCTLSDCALRECTSCLNVYHKNVRPVRMYITRICILPECISGEYT